MRRDRLTTEEKYKNSRTLEREYFTIFFRNSSVSGFLRAQAKYVDGVKKPSIH